MVRLTGVKTYSCEFCEPKEQPWAMSKVHLKLDNTDLGSTTRKDLECTLNLSLWNEEYDDSLNEFHFQRSIYFAVKNGEKSQPVP